MDVPDNIGTRQIENIVVPHLILLNSSQTLAAIVALNQFVLLDYRTHGAIEEQYALFNGCVKRIDSEVSLGQNQILKTSVEKN